MSKNPIGYHCLASSGDDYEPYVIRLSKWFDEEGFERGERINGFVQCPKCGLWWPNVEEPDMWNEGPKGHWIASGWWGGVVCLECDLLMIEQPDGTPECYQL